jgi:hypothetical protein
MRPIDKFILYVVHNWTDELNEAYKPNVVKAFVKKFKAQADRYKYSITPEELTAIVNRFDEMSTNNPKIKDKDLNNYDVRDLVRLVRSKKGTKEPEEEYDITPDVVYNENGLIIYNGSKEANCLTFGAGEEWCITRGSFGNYRFDDARKNPTFYLVRDTNQVSDNTTSDAYRKSFFVVVVGNDNTYKASDRTNNDVGGRQTEWNRWEPWSFVESNFPSVRGLRSVFKYIPLSKAEKETEIWTKQAISIEEWEDLPYESKEIYLVRRKGRDLFKDITNDEFISNPDYLSAYPDIAQFIAENAGIIDSFTLAKHLNTFSKISNQTVNSIIANMRDKIDIDNLPSRVIPFNVKVFLLEKDKWNIPYDNRLYLVKDKKGNNTIVKLTLEKDITLGLYREKSTNPDIILDKETAPYLLAYPDLDQIPFDNLMKLASDGVINRDIIRKVIEKAKTDEDSAIIVKTVDDKDIVVDSNLFVSYKIENGKVSKIPFESEEVQSVLSQETGNTSFQQNAVNIIENGEIPDRIDKDSFISIIKNTPYNNRTYNNGIATSTILVPEGESSYSLFTRGIYDDDLTDGYANVTYGGNGRNWNRYGTRNAMDESMWKAYFTYLRSKNNYYSDNQLLSMINSGLYRYIKQDFIKAKPPISAGSTYDVGELDNKFYIVNKTNPRQSLQLSDSRDRAKRISLTPSEARQILGTPISEPVNTTPARPTPDQLGAGEREPAPLPQAATPAAAQAGNTVTTLIANVGLTTGFAVLPTFIQNRILAGTIVAPLSDRSARSRSTELGTRGSVTNVVVSGQSKMFIIQLASGRIIAQVSVQPEARHYVVTSTTAFNMGRVNNFITSLDQRRISETIRNYIKKYAN